MTPDFPDPAATPPAATPPAPTQGTEVASRAPLTPEALARVRAEFPILEARTYLNSCSLGPLSHRAEGELADFLHLWHTMGASAWYEHWLDRLDVLRARVATLLGAGHREMALSPSTSVALSSVTESVDWSKRPRVVTTELDFPTLGYQFAVKPQVELVVLPSPDGVGVDPEQFAEAVDERTAFLATSHVFFTTGYRQDITRLAHIAREAGALSLIDGYQGAGQVALDLGATGVDIYTTGPLKWLCGGPGLAYLYVRDELIRRLEPRITSWFATVNPFEFDLEGFAFRDDARRFEMGTPALPTVHTALGGQAILEEVGMEVVEARNRLLTRYLEEALEGEGFAMRRASDPAHRTAIVMVRHPHPAETVKALAEEGIIVDHRPGHVRISPHFFNTTDEVDRIVAALARLPR
ncbi:MAG: aminotransferase class V-fold PLP-dependent enzyme [Gemmatimonadales bacterium]|nr:MAG: aminotransferase class V-fold PLP-dependent enzyme [Gemmatimonadales bacterium]